MHSVCVSFIQTIYVCLYIYVMCSIVCHPHVCGSERQQAEEHAREDSNAIPFLEAVPFFCGPDLSRFARAPLSLLPRCAWLDLQPTLGQAAALQSPWPRLHACVLG